MFEFLFAVFLVSGYMKAILLMLGIKLPDITLLSALLMSVILFIDIYRHRFKVVLDRNIKQIFQIQIIIYILILFSSFYTKSESFFIIKIFFYLKIFIALFYPFLKREFNINRFFQYIILISAILGLLYLLVYPKLLLYSYKEMSLAVSSLYGSAATVSGLLLVIMVIFKNIFSNKILNLLFLFEFIIVLLMSGARGPLLFTILSLFVYMMFLNMRNFILYIFYSIVFIICIYISITYLEMNDTLANMFERSIERVELLFTAAGGGNSVEERVLSMNFAIDKITESLSNFFFGNGVASYGILFSGQDIKMHPHNFFIEIMFDIGFIGLFMYFIFYYKVVKYIVSYKKVLLPIFLYVFLNSMKSSSYVESRVTMGIISILLLYILQKVKNEEKSFNYTKYCNAL